MTAAVQTHPGTAGDAPPRLSFRGVLRSEWLKLVSLRSNWLMAILWVLAFVVIGPLGSFAAGTNGGDTDYGSLTEISVAGTFLAQLIIGVFGVLTVSNEYATGMVRATLTAEPRRWPTYLGRALVVLGLVLVTTEAAALVAFFLSEVVVSGTRYVAHGASITQPGVARAVLFAGLFLTLVAAMGYGLGWVIRNTAGAIATLFGILLVLPLVFNAVPSQTMHDIGRWLPSQALIDMLTVRPDQQAHAPGVAAAVMVGYAAAALLPALLLLLRRDA